MTRDQIDLVGKVWTVPAEKIKAAREHRVPLVPRAIAILEELQKLPSTELLFPGQRQGCLLSDMSLTAVLKRMKIPASVASIHGFRSSFKDWVYEATSFPNELSEAALAHVTGDETERAYRRGDALARRRKLMEAWARFCDSGTAGNVVQLRKVGKRA